MKLLLVTPPTFWPLEPALIKDRPEIRIIGEDEDLTLADNIRSAVEEYQHYTQHILCRSTWDLYLNQFPCRGEAIETPAPLASVESITYLDSAGAPQTISPSVYIVDLTNPVMGRIVLGYSQTWPMVYPQENSISVRFTAGYANPAAIPQLVKDGLLKKIQELYDGIDRRDAYYADWVGDRKVAI